MCFSQIHPYFQLRLQTSLASFAITYLCYCCEIDLICPQVAGPYPDKDANKYRVWFLLIHDQAARQSPKAKNQDQSAYWHVNAGDREL